MEWITVHPNGKDSKGQPIPVKEGQSKGEAVKSFIEKHKNSSVDALKSMAQEPKDKSRFDVEDKESGRKWSYSKKR